ncbi:MAG: ECF transporter S component [Acholeplasmataceae bacterium]|nr:ECF transporter S component [Acholeplasmataceae bacterium]
MILASLFLTLGIVLPFITGNIQFLGNKFLPMHVPVLICGFVCGWKYGGLVGFLTPLLRALLVGVPLLFPTATLMTFELSVYGIVVGFLYQHLSKKAINIYLSLLISMILGRLVWGSLAFLIYPSLGLDFSLNIMITTTVIFAIPGIIFQLIFIPVLVFAIEKNDVLLRRLQ